MPRWKIRGSRRPFRRRQRRCLDARVWHRDREGGVGAASFGAEAGGEGVRRRGYHSPGTHFGEEAAGGEDRGRIVGQCVAGWGIDVSISELGAEKWVGRPDAARWSGFGV